MREMMFDVVHALTNGSFRQIEGGGGEVWLG